jgi:hypothetical protein
MMPPPRRPKRKLPTRKPAKETLVAPKETNSTPSGFDAYGNHVPIPKEYEYDEEELFISHAQACALAESAQYVNACVQDKHKKRVEFPIGEICFDVRKAWASPKYGDGFRSSGKSEMEAIEKYEVMHPVPISEVPNSTKIFNSYMMCHRKSQGGDKRKYKSRLVADGSSCIPGVHTMEVDYSTSLPRWNAIRCCLARGKGCGWSIRAGDVRTAFLKGDKSGITIYMHMPIGMRQYTTLPCGRRVEIVMAVTGNLYGKVLCVLMLVLV